MFSIVLFTFAGFFFLGYYGYSSSTLHIIIGLSCMPSLYFQERIKFPPIFQYGGVIIAIGLLRRLYLALVVPLSP